MLQETPLPLELLEPRGNERRLGSGPIWWRGDTDERFQSGWLIERSVNSTAFLARGSATPLSGTRLTVATSEPDGSGRPNPGAREGLVRRVSHVHADLFLVAAQLRPEAAGCE